MFKELKERMAPIRKRKNVSRYIKEQSNHQNTISYALHCLYSFAGKKRIYYIRAHVRNIEK